MPKLNNIAVDGITEEVTIKDSKAGREKVLPVSGAEIDFMVYVSQLQNDLGQVRGIYYKDICFHLAIGKQTFYNILYSLEEKGVIKIEWVYKKNQSKKLWNITILNNEYLTYKDHRTNPYVKTNILLHKFTQFRELQTNVKILVIKLLKAQTEKKGFPLRIESLKKWAGTNSIYRIKKYLDALTQFFDIHESKNNTYVFKLKEYTEYYSEKDNYRSFLHRILYVCRIYNVAYRIQDINSLYHIFNSKKDLHNKLVNLFCDTAMEYRSVEPALINKLISLYQGSKEATSV